MLAKLLLVFLVGYASASHYAWKPNTEYTYRVTGRTLSGLPDHDPTMTGILIKSELRVIPKTPETLTARLQHSQYCRTQMKFRDSWEEHVPESNCQYKPLAISEEPFEIQLQDGIVKEIVVSKSLKNWEANMIKSFVSQLQLNVNAKHPIDSEINILPKQKHPVGVYKVMEKTVTGEFETIYTMKPEPDTVWPVLANELEEDSRENILVSKTKNFTNHGAFVGYHFGFGELDTSEPNTDSMGNFMNRTSVSTAVIYGDLEDYVIKASNTSNVVSFSPLFNNGQSGIIASKVSLVLKNMQPGKCYNSPSDPVEVGLMYRYDNSYGSNQVESAHKAHHVADEESTYNRPGYQRLNHHHSKKAKGPYHLDQSKQELDQPSSAMGYLACGYQGKSIKFSDKVNIAEEAKKLAHEIGQDLQHPNELPKRATISKFVVLVRLFRQMNKEEMNKVAEELYTKEHSGQKVESWKAIRDAIAQTGNGPALLTIRQWIKDQKVGHYEAAQLVSRMAVAARHPTAKYLRSFQKLAEESVEQHHHTLNDTSLIAYADLLHKVCVDKEMSYQQYPFHTYGSFYTNECQTIAQEYIRYLEQRLHKAVAHSDSHDILIFTIALGRVGHRDIYRALEKYIRQTPEKRQNLPEEQRVTEFQRFVMVSALRRFSEMYPEAARDLLKSIYFSSSEQQEIRALAAYLMAYTEPETSLLAAMAQNTQIDNDEYVNSAVKSTIHRLVDMEYEPAIHAERYLNDEEYGMQYPQNGIHKYVREQMDAELRHSFRTYSSPDHMIPNGIHGKLQIILGDADFTLGVYDVLVSSLEETLHQVEQQTHHYHEQVHKKQSHNKDEVHSSHKIYEALGINIEEREQLEGLIHLRIADAFRHFPVNNHTVDNIAHVAQHWQEELKKGHKFSLSKWTINHEAVLSAPTEMGLPYSLTAATPSLLSLDGNIKAETQPEFCDGETIRAPEHIKAHAEVRALVGEELQSSIRFYTPFEHHDYVSGYNKKMQVHVPVSVKVEVDLKNNHISSDLKPLESEQDIKIFHFSTHPYCANRDILSIQPVETTHGYTVLQQQKPQTQVLDFGRKSTGMQFELHRETDQERFNLNRFLHRVQRRGAVETAMRLLFNDDIMYSKTEFWYRGTHCANREVKMQIKYDQKNFDKQQGSAPSVQDILNLPSEQHSRLQQAIEKASAGIHSVHVMAGDVQIQFVGQQEATIRAGVASARGPVDKHSRVIAYVHTESKNAESKPWNLALVHNGESPNTNGLDYEHALKMNPKVKAHTELSLGPKDQQSHIKIDAEFQKTHERVEYLQKQPEHHRCHEQIKEGNRIMPSCANMTAQANLLDDITIRIKHEGLSHHAKYIIQQIASLARPCRAIECDFEQHHEEHHEQHDNEIEINVRFTPNLEHANYTLEGTLASRIHQSCERIPINRWHRQLLVLHPVFPVSTRLSAEAYRIDTYRPICVVDKSRAATFDGKEYDAELSDSWTVMLHYLPQFSNHSQHSDLKYRKHHQIREHAVLVRQENQGKAVKITLRSPSTEQKLVEVEMRPTGQSSPKVKVLVDKKEVHCTEQQSQDFYDRAIRVYSLPNDEVKVEIAGRYHVIADGKRVKLTATSSLFTNSTRGLCGNFNGMESDDFILPNGEVSVEPPNSFVAAYTIGSAHQKKQHHIQRESCYVRIPTFERIQELSQQQVDESESSSCTGHRTLYFRKNNKDCFTIRAYPVCKPGCHPQEEVNKKVDLICLDESSASQQWRRKAEAGDYLNFQHRQPNDHMETKIQSHCQQ